MKSFDMSDKYPVHYARTPHIDAEEYVRMYAQSLGDPDTFWAQQGHEHLTWSKEWQSVHVGEFSSGDIRWFDGGMLNVSYNCIDRHVEGGRADQVAIIWEGNDGSCKSITYRTLLEEVSKFANVLKNRGAKKGDRVCIYMPMIPEAVYAMLACARIGAVHSVVFGGFSSEALSTRINDAQCSIIITADVSMRGDKVIPLKTHVDVALKVCPSVHTSIVVRTIDTPIHVDAQYVDYAQAMSEVSPLCEPEPMCAEDPLFILYTSGSTGKPKGVVHTTAGYLLYVAMTHKYVFDYHQGDIYWCTADIGWITGHSYVVYGPLCNGATTLMFEGVPTYPSPARCWEVVDKHHVNIFYSMPTLIRTLMAHGDSFVQSTSRKSLVILGTVGEPINPEVWRWYHQIVGEARCPIVDTWWQTETGGIAIAPLAGVTPLKPGSATQPFFGIQPVIVDDEGVVLEGVAMGKLMLKGSWPGQMRGLYNDQKRFLEVYFSASRGLYSTGDGVRRDEDGYLWITGRVDDTMNISGHLIGTAEIESALVLHEAVAEAAVVAVSDEITLESICAFVTLMAGQEDSPELRRALIEQVKREVGSFAKPKTVYVVSGLPKTRSGKIMRRILRKIGEGEVDNMGDVSTLADPDCVNEIIRVVNG